jgi:hypothetical protein
MRFGLVKGFTEHFNTLRLHFTNHYTQRLVFSVTVFTVLLGSGFQQQTYPFLRVSELSPASATSFCNSQPTVCLRTQSQSYVTTDGQSASLSWFQAPIWGPRPDFYYCLTVAGLLMWGTLSDERTGLSFTIAAGPRHHSHSWVRVKRDSCPYFTLSDSRLSQPGGPGPRVYIPQEQGGPVIYPQTLGFLVVASCDSKGLRWRYSNPPPCGGRRWLW